MAPYSILPIELTADSIVNLTTHVIQSLPRLTQLILFYAATGVGKTTTLPGILSKLLGRLYILVDTVALRDSMRTYMRKFPDAIYLTKLEYVMEPRDGYILIDESHNTDHLTVHLINRVAKPGSAFLTSATAPNASADPKATLFPITEVINPLYTIQNIYDRKPLPFIYPTTSGKRVLVFAPNDRDATDLASMYTGIPVFAVTYTNATQLVPSIKSTKGPILIFSSPVLQTGFTLDIDVVVDLAMSNTVLFTKNTDNSSYSHIHVKRGPATHHERIQRRGRVGRLRRGIYVSPNVVYAPEREVSPYNEALYNLLANPITPKLKLLLQSRYHPSVLEDIVDDSGKFLYKSAYATRHGCDPEKESPYSFPSSSPKVGIRVWDHTVSWKTIYADFEKS